MREPKRAVYPLIWTSAVAAGRRSIMAPPHAPGRRRAKVQWRDQFRILSSLTSGALDSNPIAAPTHAPPMTYATPSSEVWL
jgi:hypothetical protein